ncbi:LysR family transcriptional regulator [Burkholderia sp. S-53]|uniref:LysR family transcriptional regulator n=1 Tax=Burkholderia sp. S-53 TaxID=2906514 RepID=UPI0021D3830D|nr:LysR family transcriptional regulator [Burkholderia sp. S-53]UXU92195.1 LysR family transcriptional regulator [Burkholderia sp. S-53]
MAQSTVAQQIRVLETFFGQKLLERNGRSLRLTPRARHYLVDVASCLERLAQATRQMFDGPSGQPIHVDTSASFARGWLPPHTGSTRRARPSRRHCAVRSTTSSSC